MDFSLTEPIANYRTLTGRAALAPLTLNGAGRQHAVASISRRRLPGFAAVLVSKGSGRFWSGPTGEIAVEAPALIWLFPQLEHGYGPTSSAGWIESWILFDGSLARDAQRAGYIDPARPVAIPAQPALLQRRLNRLVEAFSTIAPATAGLLVHELIVAPQQEHRDIEADDLVMAEAAELLAGGNQPSLAALADRLGMSQATLRRRFAARYGLPPKAFQLQSRLDRAKQLLTLTDSSVEVIAASIGFEDQYYFSRLFHSREHCSPTEFRRRHRRIG